MGYEVLLRSEVYSNPEQAFQAARKRKQLYELDSRSIHKAVRTYQSTGNSQNESQLFLNILPSTILNPMFPSFLDTIIIMKDKQLHRQQIVLEISESEIIDDFDYFKTMIVMLKRQGFLIAIDDIGKGYSNLKFIIELKPDYLKLDRYLAHDLHLFDEKQSLILLFADYCKQYQSQLILEGLESESELAIAKSLGVPLAQGYILGEPKLTPTSSGMKAEKL